MIQAFKSIFLDLDFRGWGQFVNSPCIKGSIWVAEGREGVVILVR